MTWVALLVGLAAGWELHMLRAQRDRRALAVRYLRAVATAASGVIRAQPARPTLPTTEVPPVPHFEFCRAAHKQGPAHGAPHAPLPPTSTTPPSRVSKVVEGGGSLPDPRRAFGDDTERCAPAGSHTPPRQRLVMR